MTRRSLLSPALSPAIMLALSLAALSPIARPAAAQGAPPPAQPNTLPLKTARTHTFTTTQGHLDFARRLARRTDHRLRHARATSTRCPSPAARRHGITSGTAPTTRSRGSARRQARSSSCPTGAAATTSGSCRSTAPTRLQLTQGQRQPVRVARVDARRPVIVVAVAAGPLAAPQSSWIYSVDGGTAAAADSSEVAPAHPEMLGAAFGPDPRYVWYAGRNGDWQYNAILPAVRSSGCTTGRTET